MQSDVIAVEKHNSSMQRNLSLRRLILTVALLVPGGMVAAPWTVLDRGHSEFHFDYSAAKGWELTVWDDNAQTRYPANDVVVRVVPAAIGSVPSGAQWTPIGATAGAPVWVIPQTQSAAVVWFGTRAIIPDGVFRPLSGPAFGSGQLGMRLISVTGSGPDAGGKFSLFSQDAFGSPTFRFSTANGIDDADLVAPINASSHTHYNWVFTKPGDYDITIEAYAFLLNSGQLVTARQTYHFQAVPTPPAIRVSPRVAFDAATREYIVSWTGRASDTYTVWRSDELERWRIDRVVIGVNGAMSVRAPSSAGRGFFRIPATGENIEP
jgi:surface-anchored protein